MFSRELRSWIDDENSKFHERQKEAKEKVVAAKDKVIVIVNRNVGFSVMSVNPSFICKLIIFSYLFGTGEKIETEDARRGGQSYY